MQNEGNLGCENDVAGVCFRKLLRMGGDSLLMPVLEMSALTKESQLCGLGSQGRYLTARESPWEQNRLPPIVNIIQNAYHS